MQKKTTNKLIFYKILLILLMIASVIIVFLIIRKYSGQEKVEEQNEKIVSQFNEFLGEKSQNENEEIVYEESVTDNENEKRFDLLEFKGFKVIGLIKIPAINLEYPILEETTKETMKVSISRYWGGDINSYGNVSLAGHNNRVTLTMFGKNKNLKNGDKIILTDLSGNTVEYQIYDTFITNPNDVTVLQTKDKNIREVTLITCSNGHVNRLINKAREIK